MTTDTCSARTGGRLGVRADRAAIEAILRYHDEQGLTRRRFTIEDIFAPSLLDT